MQPMVDVEQVAYSFGAILGDGSLKYHPVKKHCRTSIDCGDREIVDNVMGEIGGVFNVKTTIKTVNVNNKPFYRGYTYNRDVFLFFDHYTGGKVLVPKEVLNGTELAKRCCLTGLMDTDGYVIRRSTRVGFSNNLYSIVEGLALLLESLNMPKPKIHSRTKEGAKPQFYVDMRAKEYLSKGGIFLATRKYNMLLESLGYETI